MNTAPKINDGGPAFPVPPPQAETDGVMMQWRQADPGMSLRDYFAAKAMQGLLAAAGDYEKFSHMAEDAYAIADAMIAARDSAPKGNTETLALIERLRDHLQANCQGREVAKLIAEADNAIRAMNGRAI